MEIVDYIWSDGFTHHIISNSWWIPFDLYLLFIVWMCGLIYLILKKIIW